MALLQKFPPGPHHLLAVPRLAGVFAPVGQQVPIAAAGPVKAVALGAPAGSPVHLHLLPADRACEKTFQLSCSFSIPGPAALCTAPPPGTLLFAFLPPWGESRFLPKPEALPVPCGTGQADVPPAPGRPAPAGRLYELCPQALGLPAFVHHKKADPQLTGPGISPDPIQHGHQAALFPKTGVAFVRLSFAGGQSSQIPPDALQAGRRGACPVILGVSRGQPINCPGVRLSQRPHPAASSHGQGPWFLSLRSIGPSPPSCRFFVFPSSTVWQHRARLGHLFGCRSWRREKGRQIRRIAALRLFYHRAAHCGRLAIFSVAAPRRREKGRKFRRITGL